MCEREAMRSYNYETNFKRNSYQTKNETAEKVSADQRGI